jgi:hypothetical protein
LIRLRVQVLADVLAAAGSGFGVVAGNEQNGAMRAIREKSDGSDFAAIVYENGIAELHGGVGWNQGIQVHNNATIFRYKGARRRLVEKTVSGKAHNLALGIDRRSEAALVWSQSS